LIISSFFNANLSHHGKALNSIACADVPLRNSSLTHFRLPDVSREGLSFTHKLSLFLSFVINLPRSAAAQWMAIKCISEVRSSVELQQLVERARLPLI